RDAGQQPFPEPDQALTDEVRGQQPGQEYHQQREDHPEARDVEPQQRLGTQLVRQQVQRLIHGADQPAQDQDRDTQRNPDEQPGDEVTLHQVEAEQAPPLSPADAVVPLLSPELPDSADLPSLLPFDFAADFELPFLKSVTYQ